MDWCLWHWKDVRGMGLWHMREGTPWLNLLERVGARQLREQSDVAVNAYVTQVNEFLTLNGKDRAWLGQETRRDLQMLTLRKLLDKMQDLTSEELAALGRSFNSDNFEPDEPMAAALQRLMKGQVASAQDERLLSQQEASKGSEPAIQHSSDPVAADAAFSDYAGKPYGGIIRRIPGIIQAEDYDAAPQGEPDITFHYTGSVRNADLRATGDGIPLAKFGAGHVNVKGEPENPDQVYVGWTENGQWMKYSVHVEQTGTYRLGGHFAAAETNATFSVTFTPELKTGPITLPTTAGHQPGVEVYHVWETLDHLADIRIPAGDYVMTIKIENAGGMNIDYLTFSKEP